MFWGKSNIINTVDNHVQILLSQSLCRLAPAQEELHLNCEDTQQLSEVNKMVTLLTLRCILGVGKDALAFESLKGIGLYNALQKSHLDEIAFSDENTKFVTLRNVRLMGSLAKEQKMCHTYCQVPPASLRVSIIANRQVCA